MYASNKIASNTHTAKRSSFCPIQHHLPSGVECKTLASFRAGPTAKASMWGFFYSNILFGTFIIMHSAKMYKGVL